MTVVLMACLQLVYNQFESDSFNTGSKVRRFRPHTRWQSQMKVYKKDGWNVCLITLYTANSPLAWDEASIRGSPSSQFNKRVRATQSVLLHVIRAWSNRINAPGPWWLWSCLEKKMNFKMIMRLRNKQLNGSPAINHTRQQWYKSNNDLKAQQIKCTKFYNNNTKNKDMKKLFYDKIRASSAKVTVKQTFVKSSWRSK